MKILYLLPICLFTSCCEPKKLRKKAIKTAKIKPWDFFVVLMAHLCV